MLTTDKYAVFSAGLSQTFLNEPLQQPRAARRERGLFRLLHQNASVRRYAKTTPSRIVREGYAGESPHREAIPRNIRLCGQARPTVESQGAMRAHR